jgi:hypothetical protein
MAEAAFSAQEIPTTPAPTPTPETMTDAYIIGFGGAALVAIIAIGLIIILMLRKR